MKIFKYSLILILICGVAWQLWRHFVSEPDVAIVAEEYSAATDEDAVPDDVIAVAPSSIGENGIRLDFEATKFGAVIGKIRAEFARSDAAYEINVSARASGVVKVLGSGKLYFKSSGKIANGKMRFEYFSDISVGAGKNGKKKDKIYFIESGAWTHTARGKAREFDPKIFDGAEDPLTIMFYLAAVLDKGEKCDAVMNSFADRTGFRIDITDGGTRSESGIKVDGKKITEVRCDAVLWNRAGKAQKDFPFAHEFAKKGKHPRANVISVYYSKLGGENFVPVFIKVRATPVGDIDIKLVKFAKLK